LRAVNQALIRHLDGQQFLTAFYATLDPARGDLLYCNAGHSPPLLACDAASPLQALPLSGPALGIIEQADWEARQVHLPPGATLVLYTDGVTDAGGPGGTFYGPERLERAIRAALGGTAAQVRDAVQADLAAFSSGIPQFDDMAIVVLRRLSEAS
jgi:sigma-B regulation protein RsbU (phosphoserine phosphatase)